MQKISNAIELQAELAAVIRLARTPNPSRARLAAALRHLSYRVAGHDVEAASKQFPDGSGPSTPWGAAQTVDEIARGVRWVSTPGHGGLGVASGVARKLLSPAARRIGELKGGYYWYEEDVAFIVPLFEVPEWSGALARATGGRSYTKDQLEKEIRQQLPEYFEWSGLVDKPKLTPGMKVKCVDASWYSEGVGNGSIWLVTKVTSSSFIGAKDGDYPMFRFRLNDYLSTDRWEVAS
jgi:hypothetical protein